MNTMSAMPGRRFYRDADRARLGGVCAGIAGYFGFNLKATRILAIIAFFMAMPITVVAYLAAVILIPAESGPYYDFAAEKEPRKKRKQRLREATVAAVDAPQHKEIVRRRCREIDERLIRLEKLVTSKRFQLEQELRRL